MNSSRSKVAVVQSAEDTKRNFAQGLLSTMITLRSKCADYSVPSATAALLEGIVIRNYFARHMSISVKNIQDGSHLSGSPERERNVLE